MNITISEDNGRTLVFLAGRLDTTNYLDFETQMTPLAAKPRADIVLDCEAFDYISSSGLRIFLTLHKQVTSGGGSLEIRGMKPEIKDVFDMTGFSAIFKIV